MVMQKKDAFSGFVLVGGHTQACTHTPHSFTPLLSDAMLIISRKVLPRLLFLAQPFWTLFYQSLGQQVQERRCWFPTAPHSK